MYPLARLVCIVGAAALVSAFSGCTNPQAEPAVAVLVYNETNARLNVSLDLELRFQDTLLQRHGGGAVNSWQSAYLYDALPGEFGTPDHLNLSVLSMPGGLHGFQGWNLTEAYDGPWIIDVHITTSTIWFKANRVWI